MKMEIVSKDQDAEIELVNQWNDYLIREFDPYAMAKYRVLLDWVGPVKGKHCLIVGSGSGEFPALLAKAGANVLAIDIDKASIELTKQTCEKFGVKVDTRVTSLASMVGQDKYDIIAATDVIEHIKDDVAAALHLSCLLNPSGLLVISVPALNILFGYHDEVLLHFRRYNMTQILGLLNPHFRPVKFKYFGFFFIPIALVFSRMLRVPYPVASAGKAEKKRSIFGMLVTLLFYIERKVSFPLGTSILYIGRPNSKG